jgi:hypothetical protein
VIVAVVLVGGLSAVGIYALTKKSNNSTNTAAPGTTTAAPATTGATSRPTAAAPTTPAVKNTDSIYAKVGDCLAGQTMDSTTAQDVSDVRIVSCTASDAKYKVVGKVPNKTEVQFNADDHICDAYPTAVSALWQGRAGGVGSVLCLADAKKR